MGAFIAKQPNGLYCRFSTNVDCITHYNMSEEDYIEFCAEKAREDAKDTLKNHLQPFKAVIDNFYPHNMTQKEFNKILKEIGDK